MNEANWLGREGQGKMKPRRGRLAVAALLGGLGVLAALLAGWWQVGRPPSDQQLDQVVAHLKGQGLGAGYHLAVPLPAELRSLSRGGTVDAFETPDGRLIVLLKTDIGFQGNYSGIVYSDTPLTPAELGADYHGRPCVRMGRSESVIRKKAHARRYEIFFDLG